MEISDSPNDPRWVDLDSAHAFFAMPLTSPISHAARARAEAMIVQAIEGGEAISRAGGHVTGLPDLSDEIERNGVWSFFYALAVAELTVSDWRGFTIKGQPAPFNADQLAGILADPIMCDAFSAKQMRRHNQIVREGN